MRCQAHALTLDQPGVKSKPLKSTLRSEGTVSCARETFSPEEKRESEIAGGSPRSVRGTENSLKSPAPTWSAACCPLAFRSATASHAPAVTFHAYHVASSVPWTYLFSRSLYRLKPCTYRA